MSRIIRYALAVALTTASFGITPAPALTYSSCTAAYTANGQGCMFTPVGPSLYVSGHATFGGLVVLRIVDPTGAVTILECMGFGDCMAHAGPHHTGTDSVGPPAGGPLLCQVISGGRGSINCSSGI